MSRHLTTIYANQGSRPAVFLAERNDDAGQFFLYEYEMPGATTTLVELKTCEKCHGTGKVVIGRLQQPGSLKKCPAFGCWGQGYKKKRTISYARIPRYWIERIVEEGNENNLTFWPQQASSADIRHAYKRFEKIANEIKLAKEGKHD